MKRQGWLSVGLGLSLLATACSDDGGGGDKGTVDGGVTPEDLSAQIKDLNDQLDKLGMDQTNLGGRITALETPKTPGSCSAGELCIPDGISLSKQGMDPIIQAICSHETKCCSAGELSYLYGPAIKTTEDCVASFSDIVNNGITQSNGTFSGLLELVVRVAHALNDTDVKMQVNTEGVAACAKVFADQACPGAETAKPPTGCQPNDYDDGPCSLEKMIKGLEREGDTCDWNSEVPECGDGLVCRRIGNDEGAESQSGICAVKAAVGDRCTEDEDCDDLFCNFSTGLCQARAKEGEACAYVDPTFQYASPWYYYAYEYGDGRYIDSQTVSIECDQGLSCNPVTNKCAKDFCATGAFCRDNSSCPTGQVCLRTGSELLLGLNSYYWHYVGVCSAALDVGATCTTGNECGSKICDDVAVSGEYKCQPPLGADGTTCSVAGNCASNHCGADLKCSSVCDLPASSCKGDACRTCAAGMYCTAYSGTEGRCEALLVDGQTCDPTGYDSSTHHSPGCASGYCNGSNQCGPKVAAGGTCTAGHHAQCPGTQFCNAGTCADTAAVGAACTSTECGPNGTCWDVDGPVLSGTVKRCYEGAGSPTKMPNGNYCTTDNQCESTWCRSNGTTTVCTKRLDDGAACDTDNEASDHCGVDSFCAYVKDTTAGVCKKRGLVGDSCEPRFGGSDCFKGYGCELEHERFQCSSANLPTGKVWCHASEVL